jgi:hypothetical protein
MGWELQQLVSNTENMFLQWNIFEIKQRSEKQEELICLEKLFNRGKSSLLRQFGSKQSNSIYSYTIYKFQALAAYI